MRRTAHLSVISLFSIVLTGGCAEPDGFHYRSQPTLSGDRSLLIASVNVAGTPSIYELSLRGKAPTRLTDGADLSPAVSPDGQSIVFARRQRESRQSLHLLDRRTGGIRALTAASEHDDYPVFIGERSVAFLRAGRVRSTSTGGERWIDWDIFVIDIDKGLARRVTSSFFWEATPPSVLNEGASLLLSAGRVDETRRPIVVDLSNGQTRPVGLPDDGPVSSIDNNSMVVVRQTGTDPKTDAFVYDLFASSLDGKRRRQLTDLNTHCERPIFQRDIGVLLFLTDESRSGPAQLWQMTLDGSPSKLEVRLP